MSSQTTSGAAAGHARSRWRIGPAFVTAALVFGPGSITTASSLGAGFAYDLVWVPVVATILMLCFVNIAVRIGLTTDQGSVGTVSARFGRIVGILIALGALVVVASFQAGNSVGAGAAAEVLFDTNTAVLAGVFTAVAIAFVWLPSFYRNLERVMVPLVLLMLVLFVITAVVSQPDPGALLRGLIPTIPTGSNAVVVAAVATTFSVVGAFYQITLVREKGWGPDEFVQARRDASLGTVILGGLSFVIMIAAAGVLNPAGETVSSPADLAAVLQPIGQWAPVLFAIGLWAAAFTSLVGNATIGGSMLAGAIGKESGGLDSPIVKVCVTVVMAIGGIVAIVFGGIPIQLILTAQAVTIFIVPLIGLVMVLLARHRDRGRLKISIPQLVLAGLGVLFLILLAITYAGKFL
ncbi:Nramp family divalent metal transporter [Microbacterium sp. JB110]|uniref:Nramp family divalent metal transporter n=1 Tax=Microbacterium sp. JB110 TaxID=2024477 RepID=UPI00097ECD2A|nr:Nramp family divalent metal transporter [Microbacterium sp. JB110]RCS60097.1 divalent metal cation transporter [Microbacterium sp. JB110]SJM45417.1 Manganese transport protein MntH [Frigoribacterium sp. JB110]